MVRIKDLASRHEGLRVYVFQDGFPTAAAEFDGFSPKQAKWLKTNEQILSIDAELKNCTVRVSPSQLGCRDGVITAIDWFFEQEDEGIVLEDDIIISDSFLGFATKCLELYRNNYKVAAISGSSFAPNGLTKSSGYTFSRYCFNWGWATWKNKWVMNHPNSRPLPKGGKHFPPEFSLVRRLYWSLTFTQYDNKSQSDVWDFLWLRNLFAGHMLTVVPCKNMCVNCGFDSAATNTSKPTFKQKPLEDYSGSIKEEVMIPDRMHDDWCSRKIYRISILLVLRTAIASCRKSVMSIAKRQMLNAKILGLRIVSS